MNEGRDWKDLHSFPLLPQSLCHSVLCTLTMIIGIQIIYILHLLATRRSASDLLRMPVVLMGESKTCSHMYLRLYSSAQSGSYGRTAYAYLGCPLRLMGSPSSSNRWPNTVLRCTSDRHRVASYISFILARRVGDPCLDSDTSASSSSDCTKSSSS
jgi:hypothetical protein